MNSITLPATSTTSPTTDAVDTRVGVTLHTFTVTFKLIAAKDNKEKAQSAIDDLTSVQEKAEECADMIDEARQAQSGSANIDGVTMPDVVRKYFYVNSLSVDSAGGDQALTSDQWDNNIKTLTNFQATLDNDAQRLMASAQDYMGQYNYYLTDVNSAIQQSNQTLGPNDRGR